jgi:hypothetical protein
MEAACSSETVAHNQKTTWRDYYPELWILSTLHWHSLGEHHLSPLNPYWQKAEVELHKISKKKKKSTTKSVKQSPSDWWSLSWSRNFPHFMEARSELPCSYNAPWGSFIPIYTLMPYLRSILIFSYHLRLCLPPSLFPSGFPTKILYTFLISPLRTTCPAHSNLLDLIIFRITAKSTNHEAPHYVISSGFLILPLT